MKFYAALTLLFIAFKLTGVITWSWWLVLLPLYWFFAVIALTFFGTYGFLTITDYILKIKRKIKRGKK